MQIDVHLLKTIQSWSTNLGAGGGQDREIVFWDAPFYTRPYSVTACLKGCGHSCGVVVPADHFRYEAFRTLAFFDAIHVYYCFLLLCIGG